MSYFFTEGPLFSALSAAVIDFLLLPLVSPPLSDLSLFFLPSLPAEATRSGLLASVDRAWPEVVFFTVDEFGFGVCFGELLEFVSEPLSSLVDSCGRWVRMPRPEEVEFPSCEKLTRFERAPPSVRVEPVVDVAGAEQNQHQCK